MNNECTFLIGLFMFTRIYFDVIIITHILFVFRWKIPHYYRFIFTCVVLRKRNDATLAGLADQAQGANIMEINK